MFCCENTLYLSMYEDIIESGSECPEILNADRGSIKHQDGNKYHIIETEKVLLGSRIV